MIYYLLVKETPGTFSGWSLATAKEQRYTSIEKVIDERNRLQALRQERIHIMKVESTIIG